MGVTSNGFGERGGRGRYDKQVVLGLGKCLVIVMLSLFMRFGTLPGPRDPLQIDTQIGGLTLCKLHEMIRVDSRLAEVNEKA